MFNSLKKPTREEKIINDHNIINLKPQQALKKLKLKLQVLLPRVKTKNGFYDYDSILTLLCDINVLFDRGNIKNCMKTNDIVREALGASKRLNYNKNFNRYPKSKIIEYEQHKLRVSLLVKDYLNGKADLNSKLNNYIFDKKDLLLIDLTLKKITDVDLPPQLYEQIINDIITNSYNQTVKYLQTKDETNYNEILFYEEVLYMLIDFKDGKLLTEELISNLEDNLEQKKNDVPAWVDKTEYIIYLNSLKSVINQKSSLTLDEEEKKYKLAIKNLQFTPKLEETVKNQLKLNLNRKDITNEYAITIDTQNTKIRDDALTISKETDGSFVLGFHTSDVLAAIPFNHDLMNLIKERPMTTYKSKRKINMLPTKLVSKYLSLDEKKLRPVMSYYIKICPTKNEIKLLSIEENILKVAKNLSIKEVNQQLKFPSNDQTGQTIELFKECNEILKEHVNNENLYTYFNGNSKKQSFGEDLVKNSVYAVNNLVAKKMSRDNNPFIYRNHAFSSSDIYLAHKQKNNQTDNNNQNVYESIYANEEFCLDNQCNDRLQFKHFANVTSPLRKSVDLANNLSIKVNELNSVNLDEESLENYLEEVSNNTNSYLKRLNLVKKKTK